MLEQASPDLILHCAAQVPKAMKDYQDDASANTSLQMLDLLLSASTCPIVYISSMTVYGGSLDRPIVENDAGKPASAYGTGKWLGEQHLKADGRPALAVRLPGLFGPLRRNGLVYNLVYAAKHGHCLPVLPISPVSWAAMHVEDAAASIVKLAASKIGQYEAINIGYRGRYSIETLVSFVGDLYHQRIEYGVIHPHFEFDLARAESLDAVPNCNLRDALVRLGNEI
jgi:nucleoside-diphosphate-sugar epimerase